MKQKELTMYIHTRNFIHGMIFISNTLSQAKAEKLPSLFKIEKNSSSPDITNGSM